MESSKMYCPSRCRYRTDQLGARNYPVSREVVQGPEWKYAKLRPYHYPWYRVCTKAMVISKGSYGHGQFNGITIVGADIVLITARSQSTPFYGGSIGPRMEICETSVPPIPMVQRQWLYKKEATGMESSKMYCPSRCRYRTFTAWKQSTPFHGGQYRAQNGNMRNFGPTNPHGTAFASKQWLYQKEATGMESSKMYCPSRCRYRTYHCVEAKYPVSWGVVQGPEWKYAKLRPFQFT